MQRVLKWLAVGFVVVLLTACGGNSAVDTPNDPSNDQEVVHDDTNNSNDTETNTTSTETNTSNTGRIGNLGAYFEAKSYIAGLRISNMEYQTEGLVGYTNDDGEFYFNPESPVSFYVAGVKIATVQIPDAEKGISLFDFVNFTDSLYADKFMKIIVLLSTFDENHNLNDGVDLSTNFDNMNNMETDSSKKLAYGMSSQRKVCRQTHRNSGALKKVFDSYKKSSYFMTKVNENYPECRDNVAPPKFRCEYSFDIFDERANIVDCDDYQKAFWLERYARHLKKIANDNILEEGEAWEGTMEQVNSLITQIDAYKDIVLDINAKGYDANATIKEIIKYSKAISTLLSEKLLSSTDQKISVEKQNDFVFALLNAGVSIDLYRSDSKNKDENALKIVKSIMNSLGLESSMLNNDDAKSLFQIASEAVSTFEALKSGDRNKILRQAISFSKTLVLNAVMSFDSVKKIEDLSNNSISNFVEAGTSAIQLYTTCMKPDIKPGWDAINKDIPECLEEVYSVGKNGFLIPFWKDLAAVTHYYIWKDNRKLQDSLLARSKVLEYFVRTHFFQNDIIDADLLENESWYSGIEDALRNTLPWMETPEIKHFWKNLEKQADMDLDEYRQVISEMLYEKVDAIINASKGIMIVRKINNDYAEINFFDPVGDALSATYKKVQCTLNNKIVFLSETFSTQSLEKKIFFDQKKTIQDIHCEVEYLSENSKWLKGRQINESFSVDQGQQKSKEFYAPVCLSSEKRLYLTELFLDKNKKSFLGDKISTTRPWKSNRILQHAGIDVRAKEKTVVVAVADGEVTKITKYVKGGNSGGNIITLLHDNGYITKYMHLNKIEVHVGQKVKVGQEIGLSGYSGLSSGQQHLHFEVIRAKNGYRVDPVKLGLFRRYNKEGLIVENFKRGHVSIDADSPSRCGFQGGQDGGGNSNAPSKPLHVYASNGRYIGKIRIYNYESNGASMYKIYRGRSLDELTFLTKTPKTEYFDADTTLKEGVKYYYKVEACKDTKCSGLSNESDWGSIKPSGSLPSMPPKPRLRSPGSSSSPGTTLTDTTPSLSWYATDAATYYKVIVSDEDSGSSVFYKSRVTSTSVTTSALLPGHKYYWDVRACNAAGCSASWSDSLYFQIKGNGGGGGQNLSIDTPSATCKNNAPEISLSWSSSIDNVSAYKLHSNRVFPSGIYYKDVPNRQTNIVLSEGLRSNYSYRFYIRAELTDGQIVNSNEVNVRTGDCDHSGGGGDAPDKPGSLSPGSRSKPYPELSNTNITLRWSSVKDATYYRVSLFDLNTITQILDGTRTTNNSYNASSNLRMGHSYFWEVKACNDNGCSSNRRVYFDIKGEVVAPDKPTGLRPGNRSRSNPEKVDTTSVTLNWNRASRASYYKVHVATSSGVIVVRSARVNGTSYSLRNLDRGKKYQWWVDACNDDECTESDWYRFEVKAPHVGTPANLSVSVNDTRVGVAWTGVNNATKYRVRLYDEDGSDDRSEYVTKIYTSFSGLSRGHRYKIKVRAYIGLNYGSYTSYKYFEIKDKTTPPSISSINPNPITRSSNYQYITIYGSHFTSGSRVQWKTSNGNSGSVSSGHTYYQSSGRIKIRIQVVGSSRTWSFKVVNTDGTSSSWKSVSVRDSGGGACALDNFTNRRLSETFNYGDKDTDKGGSKHQVRQLQRFLNALGYNAGTADGIYGDNTYYAVKRYQRAKNLEDDGLVGPNTRSKINSTSCD